MADAAAYRDQLQQLLPPGAAWPRDPDAELTRLLDGLSAELARVDARAARLADEADPRTALELLADWERVVGLPDACSGQIAATVPERRLAIVARLTARGGQSAAYFTQLAASLGYAVAVEEFAPARAGRLRAGDPCYAADWVFAFRIDVLPPSAAPGGVDPIAGGATLAVADTRFRAGAARAGDRLRSFGSTALECVVNRARPAHTTAIFAYPLADAPAFAFDFTA